MGAIRPLTNGAARPHAVKEHADTSPCRVSAGRDKALAELVEAEVYSVTLQRSCPKGYAWTSARLRRFGGLWSSGVAYLSYPQLPPTHRTHLPTLSLSRTAQHVTPTNFPSKSNFGSIDACREGCRGIRKGAGACTGASQKKERGTSVEGA
jgi:hypothetical protein